MGVAISKELMNLRVLLSDYQFLSSSVGELHLQFQLQSQTRFKGHNNFQHVRMWKVSAVAYFKTGLTIMGATRVLEYLG
jgi:hypothetical protein